MTIDIIIPSTNGLELFKKHLPSAISNTPNLNKIIIIDNASTDDSIVYAKSLSSKVEVIRNNTNKVYTAAINQGAKRSNADLIIVLNNDVHVFKGYLDNALKLFKDPKLFAVTFNEEESSYPEICWKGKFEYQKSRVKDKLALSPLASGGSAIFRKSIWDEIGGFNEVYSPGYWEDIDLGWTAWRSGYEILFDPSAKVKHQHESTFSQTNQSKLQLIKERNELLFNWQHFLSKEYGLSHLYLIVAHTFLHPGYIKVVFLALIKISQLRKLKCRYTSAEVFKKLNDKKEFN